MRKYYLFFVAAFSLLAISCKQKTNTNLEKTTNIDLIFKASYGNTPLILNKKYNYTENLFLQFSKFNFYISNMALLTSTCTGAQVELTEVEVVDFNASNIDSLSALNGFTLELKNIPVGDYAGIRFGIGVPPDLNRDTPDKYSASHPLGQSSEYNTAWKSYIFSKIEGGMDTNQDGAYDLDIAYHTGSNENYKEVCLFGDISLINDELGEVNLNVDLKKLFITDEKTFDIVNTPNTESEEGLQTANTIMNNFKDAFSLK